VVDLVLLLYGWGASRSRHHLAEIDAGIAVGSQAMVQKG
jgi:hypothetical protein